MGNKKGASASDAAKVSRDWSASAISNRDVNKLRALGLISSSGDDIRLPGAVSRPRPPKGFTVMFTAFLFRGLSLPAHEFLRSLLFFYGIQLWQLTPNSILHLSIFITVCEAFLGIDPHWGLWRKIFYVKRHNDSNGPPVVGGLGFVVRKEVDYFDYPMKESMEPYVQTETYDLENGGSLVFERDLYPVFEKLERPPPQFHGVRIHNTPAGEQQHTAGWTVLLTPFEGLARVCGQNIAALRGSRFAHFARHDTMGEPMSLSSHPVLKIHVEHLDFMLHETRKDLELTRVHAHRAQMALAHHADAIRLLAKDRRSLLQRAKNVATITRLREKIRTLEVTVRTQQDQIQEMEEDGEDIQGGDDFLSDDNDFEDDEFTDEEDYEFLESAEDGIIPIDVDEDDEE
ncbi:hypothetical protein QYE76_053202 [Lolium multiflorum]|uniref:Transposase (putative) gypsy type domain-containing protein n=1 Tax=Lolium multiflorum TaxID=4521 RepID=A0AAD8SX10_LOLMU|nr:hypothetical protein QYE76_053202 [Lolium multiflorum]